MHEINSIDEMNSLISQESFILFYLSRPGCGTCGAVKPKILKICENHPALKIYHVDLDKHEEIAGQFSIFTIPGILVFAEGKEAVREARNFSISDIDNKLQRLSALMN